MCIRHFTNSFTRAGHIAPVCKASTVNHHVIGALKFSGCYSRPPHPNINFYITLYPSSWQGTYSYKDLQDCVLSW